MDKRTKYILENRDDSADRDITVQLPEKAYTQDDCGVRVKIMHPLEITISKTHIRFVREKCQINDLAPHKEIGEVALKDLFNWEYDIDTGSMNFYGLFHYLAYSYCGDTVMDTPSEDAEGCMLWTIFPDTPEDTLNFTQVLEQITNLHLDVRSNSDTINCPYCGTQAEIATDTCPSCGRSFADIKVQQWLLATDPVLRAMNEKLIVSGKKALLWGSISGICLTVILCNRLLYCTFQFLAVPAALIFLVSIGAFLNAMRKRGTIKRELKRLLDHAYEKVVWRPNL